MSTFEKATLNSDCFNQTQMGGRQKEAVKKSAILNITKMWCRKIWLGKQKL